MRRSNIAWYLRCDQYRISAYLARVSSRLRVLRGTANLHLIQYIFLKIRLRSDPDSDFQMCGLSLRNADHSIAIDCLPGS
jgi:hypothetical protein